jgi:hypothetical protein
MNYRSGPMTEEFSQHKDIWEENARKNAKWAVLSYREPAPYHTALLDFASTEPPDFTKTEPPYFTLSEPPDFT